MPCVGVGEKTRGVIVEIFEIFKFKADLSM